MLFRSIAKRRLVAIAGTGGLLLSLATAGPALASTTDKTPSPGTTATYLLDVNGQQATLTEGETAVFQMHSIASTARHGIASPDVVYPGDGTGTITVTASGGVYHWSIAMHIPATTFVGAFHVTDLTSGFGGGSVPAFTFSGSDPTSKLHGHRYSGTIGGEALFLGVPVATTGPNNTLYTYP